jgi:hypothetical protein
MILQEGRYYLARNGKPYGPVYRYEQERIYQFFCDGESWTEGGKTSVGHDSQYDLITEFAKVEVNPPAPSPDATPKVDRVVLASKILPRLTPDLAPSMAARQALQYADAFLKEISNGNDQD